MSSGTPSPTGAPAADDPTGPHGGALVGPGDVLAHRYRLVDPVPGPAGALASVWRAEDEVLARSVAVKAFPGRHAVTDDVLDAAARAGAADARALPRTYDAARELRPERSSVAYVITEWVDGTPLVEALSGGPLPPLDVAELGIAAAEALARLHAAGAVHGRVHPGNVLLADEGGCG